ncbi:MAG: hypothetical protein Q4C34_07185 [Bacteroidales bacterium]|nr:hypothetical protein [Bacteroidales bacterium]
MKIAVAPTVASIGLCYALVVIALLLWPGAGAVTVSLGFALTAVAAWALLRTCRFDSVAIRCVMLGVLTVLTVGVVINTWYFTTASGGTLADPVLQNYDAQRTWGRAAFMLFDRPMEIGASRSDDSALFWVVFMWLFGANITVPLLVSTFCAVMAIIMAGKVAYRVTGDARVARLTMIFMALTGYFLSQATVLIKDCPLTLAMALMAYGLAGISRSGRPSETCLPMFAAVVITAVLRPHMLLMYAVGALFFIGRGRRGVIAPLVVAAVCLLVMWGKSYIGAVTSPVIIIESSDNIVMPEASTAAYDGIIGDYLTMPLWRKLLWLPVMVVVQFLVPFPWNFSRDIIFGPTMVLAHCDYVWYLAGGLIVYWLAVMARRAPAPLLRIVLWGVALTVGTALMTSGRVSRYCLPFLPLLLPAAASAVVYAGRRRSLQIWMAVFVTMLASGLIVCHHLQMSAL